MSDAADGAYLYPGDMVVWTGGNGPICVNYTQDNPLLCMWEPSHVEVTNAYGNLPTDAILSQWLIDFSSWVVNDFVPSILPDPCDVMAIQGDECTSYFETGYVDIDITSWLSTSSDPYANDWLSYDGYYDEYYYYYGSDSGGCVGSECYDPCYPIYCLDE